MLNLKSQSGNCPTDVDECKSFAKDNAIAMEYLLAFIDDISNTLPLSLYGAADSAKDKAEIVRRFTSEGLSFATLALPKLSAGLFQYLETGHAHYPSFKLKKGTDHPVFLQSLFRLALHDNEHEVTAIRLIYQISVMFSKLKGPYPHSVLSKQLADFVTTDTEGQDIDWFSTNRLQVLERARYLIKQVLKDFCYDHPDFIPRPGPGATNDPVAKHLRYRPHMLYTQIDDVMDYIEFFNVNPWDAVDQTSYYLGLKKKAKFRPRARFKFVHKKVGKARGICIEQFEMQWCQQALRRCLYALIEKSSLTKGKINFKKQCINALLALSASLNRTLATIDMSEASDRVFRELVSWLMQDCEELHNLLMALSTRYIDLPFEVNGVSSIKTTKYAPMGSALCFPVMSLVHWALCQSIIDVHAPLELHTQEVYVYGDDIIVPSDVVELVYQHLPLFGMKLNVDKSFYRSHFRESCGVHAYKGVEITPVYFKHLPVSHSYTMAMSCVAVESDLVMRRYGHTAHLLETHMRRFYKLPYVPVNCSVFGLKRSNLKMVSGEPYPSSRGYDSWGNPTKKHRVVVQSKESIAPPSEVECYLRHVITRDSDKCVDEVQPGTSAVWKRLTYSELHSVQMTPFLQHFRERFCPQDTRCDRDIKMEESYDFTQPVLSQVAARYPWYATKRVCACIPATLASRWYAMHMRVARRLSRYLHTRSELLHRSDWKYAVRVSHRA